MKKTIGRHPPRFKTDLAVKFRLANSSTDFLLGRLVNLSAGGLCLWTKANVNSGEKIEMIVESVDKKGQKRRRLLRAKVSWVKGEKAGLEFEKIKASPVSARGKK
jgi:hypothetical protein